MGLASCGVRSLGTQTAMYTSELHYRKLCPPQDGLQGRLAPDASLIPWPGTREKAGKPECRENKDFLGQGVEGT